MSVPPAATAGVSPAWQRVRRLLAVRLDNLGDLLMTTPALAALREGLPDAQITLLTSPVGALAAPHLDMVDAVWSYTASWMRLGMAGEARPGRAELDLVGRLAEGRFDAAVIFTVCTQSALPAALICLQAGIPLRLAHCRENPYALLSDWVPETDRIATGMRHEAQRQLDLVASVGMRTGDPRLRFTVDPEDRRGVVARLAAKGVDAGASYAVLHPGASAPSRRWPAERFGAVAEQLRDATGCSIVFSGDLADQPLVDEACCAMRRPDTPGIVNLAGALSLGELAALIESAEVLVANNSGPAHLAAAVGTPVVSLYALTNPQHAPWQVPSRVLSHDVPCRWCLKSSCPQVHHLCLRAVPTEEAASAALALMDVDRPDRSARIRHRQIAIQST